MSDTLTNVLMQRTSTYATMACTDATATPRASLLSRTHIPAAATAGTSRLATSEEMTVSLQTSLTIVVVTDARLRYYGDGRNCVPIYDPAHPPHISKLEMLDYISLIETKRQGPTFTTFRGVDFKRDFMKVNTAHLQDKDAAINYLRDVCLKLPQCVAFTENGLVPKTYLLK